MSNRYLTSITKLNGKNYHDWKFAVSMTLWQKGCWDVILGLTAYPITASRAQISAWEKKAEEGLTIIGLTVESSQYIYICEATNGVDAWDKLRKMYEKNSHSTCINLKWQFYGFEHKIEQPIQAYISGITELAGKLKAIGVDLSDEEITDVLIFNLDNENSNIAATLVASKADLKPGDVASTLLEEEQRKGGAPGTESMLYTNGINNDGYGPKAGTQYGLHRDNDRQGGFKDNCKCYCCGRIGHISRDCRATTTADGKDLAEEPKREISAISYQVNTCSTISWNIREKWKNIFGRIL